LSALSLKAPWNCVRMSAQNPRREARHGRDSARTARRAANRVP
jgi:hypothetical protein